MTILSMDRISCQCEGYTASALFSEERQHGITEQEAEGLIGERTGGPTPVQNEVDILSSDTEAPLVCEFKQSFVDPSQVISQLEFTVHLLSIFLELE